MKNFFKIFGIIAIMAIIGFSIVGCKDEPDDSSSGLFWGSNNGSNDGSSGGSKIPGSTKENAIPVSIGYSSSHTISKDGKQWFSFLGTGDTVIFETQGNVVDTYMSIYTPYVGWNDNGGEGSNALISVNTNSGTTYFIQIETLQGTSGVYTLMVKAASPVNIRTNPISVTVGYSSSYNIAGGQYWYSFQGTNNSVVFETESNVVNTTIQLYIGNDTSYILFDESRISFSTVSGTTYYIKITSSNSGTYTFNVCNGTGDGSSKSNAIPVTVGYSSSHTISRDDIQWFSFFGTGNTVVFETKGNVVDTYMSIYTPYVGWNDNGGEGSNALISVNTTSRTTYFIQIETLQGTSGTYTFVVRNP